MSFEDGAAVARVGSGPNQTMRKGVIAVALLLSFAFLFVAASYWPDGSLMHEGIEWAGIVLILLCMLGRAWCTLYIGGRKNGMLVTEGPYSICRNPLYVFSIIGAVGAGAQFGSVTSALIAGLVTYVVFLRTALREEASLVDAFGERYRAYSARVPRFFPKLSLWTSPDAIVVQPRKMLLTIADAAVFFIAVPVVETFEYLHDAGYLTTYFRLP